MTRGNILANCTYHSLIHW